MFTLQKFLLSVILNICIDKVRICLFPLYNIENNSHIIKKRKNLKRGGALLPILSLLYTDFQLFTKRAPPS